jgi:hypothetical protein
MCPPLHPTNGAMIENVTIMSITETCGGPNENRP